LKTAPIIYHKEINFYDFGYGHPFRADRFTKYLKLIEEHNWFSKSIASLVEPNIAEVKDLLLVHSENYVDEVDRKGRLNFPLSGDTPLNSSIVNAAYFIVGASLKAGELVVSGEVEIANGVGGGLHHAGRDYGGGFCVFNDVAVCAKAMLQHHGLDRVLVFDTDVHAGNGTMDIFYEDSDVLFVSVHQDPFTIYPGTGFAEQIGRGKGEGYTVNVPLPQGAGDKCMRLVIEEVFKPIVREFEPQLIIRNGGSDPHFLDGLGSLKLTYDGLRSIGEAVSAAAERSKCGVVDLCCSGYNPETVAEGWLAIISGEIGVEVSLVEKRRPPEPSERVIEATKKIISGVKRNLREYWRFD
jgi:acetoin utilization protein AcuC